MKSKLLFFESLKFISNYSQNYRANKTKISFWLGHIGKFLAKALIQTKEVQVWQKTNHQGDTYWEAYDPATDQTAYFSTELEVRVWIEKPYFSLKQLASSYHNFTLRR
ncbi:hypothetical protein H6G76_17580 [Nostoc sp. FACHB-152]|uniref:hypothetical protein n=1 Tax=unclassified Nostoc TaxID=2593658 RepID=UPI00168438C5|nr:MULTISPECIES: hypothetical protein [unclassified Nostoc]MBD2448932.1 hypothetical protein [Nostoc sp. FACHB-152]MBD2471186.1 hypothetical protein [Nostoc sp. FACHB-145]